jgi:hypothetical protein
MMDLPYPQEPKSKAGCGRLLIVLALIFLSFLAIAVKSVINDAVVNSPHPIASIVGSIIGCIFLLAFIFGPLLLAGISLIKQDDGDRKRWEQRKEQWQQAMRVWLTLRYCHRDHVVYRSPDMVISPTMVQKFVYDQVASSPVGSRNGTTNPLKLTSSQVTGLDNAPTWITYFIPATCKRYAAYIAETVTGWLEH